MRTRLALGMIFALAFVGAGAWFFAQEAGPAAGWFGKSPVSGREIPDGTQEYFAEEFGFSLLYPEDMAIREQENAVRSRTVVFEDKERALTFQLFFGPYHEPVITEERFKKDIPSGIVRDPETIEIDGGEATFFYSQHLTLGEMAEVWFIRDGYLYEFTAPAPLATWLREIAQTWRSETP